AGSSPSWMKRSRTNLSAREIASELGIAAARAAEVDSAIEALDFETETAQAVSAWLERAPAPCARRRKHPAVRGLRIQHVGHGLKSPARYLAPLATMRSKRLWLSACGAALLALLVAGLAQLSFSRQAQPGPLRLTPAQMRERLSGSPGPLGALHAQAGQLLPGG